MGPLGDSCGLGGPSFRRLEEMLDYGSNHYPTKTAVTYIDRGIHNHISYGELNNKARLLAMHLEGRIHASTGDVSRFVGIFLDRSVNQIVATLAILMAGMAYVPLALDSTKTSLSAIVDQARLGLILTDSEQHQRLHDLLEHAGCSDVTMIDVSQAESPYQEHESGSFMSRDGESPAYVLFSSGTTGTPKGIVTSHLAVQTYCKGANTVYQASSEDKWVRAASYTFDSSVDELFCPLAVGAEIVIQPNSALSSFESYLQFLNDSGATILTMTTALWHQFANYVLQGKQPLPPKIRLVSIGGEAGATSVFKAWRARFKDYPRLLNGYGPTEATVCATYWEAEDYEETPILPIGRPLRGYKCYILDPITKDPVNTGEVGALFISGPGLAIGYLENPALTERQFLPNPCAESPEYSRMYNTGDLARVDGSGVLHFSGRADLQVKIRGFRVELESIESCLLSLPGVNEAAAVASVEQQSHSISAYIVPLPGCMKSLFAEDILEHCVQTLAHYEIPAHFYLVEKLPYTRSRKLDRHALKRLSTEPFPYRNSNPTNESLGRLGSILANLWCQCLNHVSPDSLSAQSHFIRLGGHSLTLITLAAKISSATGAKVSAIELLENPTLAQMSQLLGLRAPTLEPMDSLCSDSTADGYENTLTDSVGNTHPLSSAQARLYTVQQKSPDSPVFNDGVAITITGNIVNEDIRAAMEAIIQRHAILRVKLVQDSEAQIQQETLPFDESFFGAVFSYEHLERPAAVRRAHEIFGKPFDLFQSPLIRVALLSSEGEHILVVCAHHIIWDGFSDKIFLDELVSLYQGKKLLPAPSYFRQCYSSRGKPDAERLASLVSYLDSVPQLIDLPVDFVRPESQAYSRGSSVRFTLNQNAVARLVARLGTTPFACLATAFAVTLHLNAACQEDFLIGVPFANRTSVEEASTIGFFINMLPLRIRFANISTMDELHTAIRQDLHFLAGMQDVPFDLLVNALNFNRLTSTDTLLQAVLNFTDAPEGSLDDRATFSRFPMSNGAAHTDLTWFIEVGNDGSLLGEVEYDTELFAPGSIESLASAFVHILDNWSIQPTQSIGTIKFPESSAHIPSVNLANDSFGAFLAASSVTHWDRQAVYDDNTETSYTYKELFSISQQIQYHLRALKRPGARVLLLLERNIEAIAAQIGVSLAGLVFIPCDIFQPLLRIREIIADSNPACIIAHRHVLQRLNVSVDDFSMTVLTVDELYDNHSLERPAESIVADDAGEVAYMIYTSGSTGTPKGIVIGQASIVEVIRQIATWSGNNTVLNSIATCNLAWDMMFTQTYPALATGGCVKLPKLNGDRDGEYLSSLMKRSPAVNFIGAAPSAMRMWLDQTEHDIRSFFPDGMVFIVIGGEELTPGFTSRVLSHAAGSPNVQVVQTYGPTEGTLFSSRGVVKHADWKKLTRCRRLPIDAPLSHAAMTVVSAAGHEIPRGFVGEIVIWGPCLMLGYNNLPQLNKDTMLVKDGVRGWRTGDLGRHLPSGGYEIFGRVDSMCKIKGGFRVCLSEIETHIRSHVGVDDCYVTLANALEQDGNSVERQIVAYVKFEPQQKRRAVADRLQPNSQVEGQPSTGIAQGIFTTLYRHLARRLPVYMIPDYVVPVTHFPLTNSTKIDKSKLRVANSGDRFIMATDDSLQWTAEDESRRSTIEAIVKIFAFVLSTDKKLSPKDNFYNCGGHSLLATRVISLIRRDLDVPLPFTAIITHPTASELAEFVETFKLQSAWSVRLPPHIVPLQPVGHIPHPKAMLFVFPFIGGDLDMLPLVVNQLNNEELGLVTYGICWEPDRNLNTLDATANAYAESIASLAGSTPCFLLGWCYGGMIASKTALKLPKPTTHLILLDVVHIAIMHQFAMDEADYAKSFAEYLCKVWFGPGIGSDGRSSEKASMIQAVLDAKLDWHDTVSLVALARRHVTLPPWVTDADLAQRMLPLADSHDLMVGVYSSPSCTAAEAIDIEERVLVNLQATDGVNVIFDTETGVGWSQYEVIDTDHDTIGCLPVTKEKILSAIREILL